jgi:hypothetical protein
MSWLSKMFGGGQRRSPIVMTIFVEGPGNPKLYADIANHILEKVGQAYTIAKPPNCYALSDNGINWPPPREYVFAVLRRDGLKSSFPRGEIIKTFEGQAFGHWFYVCYCAPDFFA